MKKFIIFIYRLFLVSLMVIGLLFLAEIPPFQENETETTVANNNESTSKGENPNTNTSETIESNKENNDSESSLSDKVEDVFTEIVTKPTSEPTTTPTVTPTPVPTHTPAPTSTPTNKDILNTTTDNYSPQTTLSGRDALQAISDSIVTHSTGYGEYFGNTDFSVFAESVQNAFSFNTAVWYNLWGGNVQDVTLNALKLSNQGNLLSFKAGIASGGDGTATLSFFFDNDMEVPASEYTLDAKQPPVDIVIDLKEITTLHIKVTNHASEQNRIICFDLVLESEETTI